MTKIYDRKTKQIQSIPQYGGSFLDFLYGNPFGRILLRLANSHLLSNVYGLYAHSRLSHKKIETFCRKNHIDTENTDQYKTFSDFFTREEKREIARDKNALISPADSKLLCYKISDDNLIKIKHSTYSIDDLICQDSRMYKNGYCLVFRLTIDDYHRYCFIDDGEIADQKHIKGRLHTVSSFSNKYKVFAQNDRIVNHLQTENFGRIIQIELGAMLVGRIKNHDIEMFKKGEEKGYFDFGGSTIVILADDKIKIDQDILEQSRKGIETKVNYGERIGERC